MNRRDLSVLVFALCPMLASPWAFAHPGSHEAHIHQDALVEAIDQALPDVVEVPVAGDPAVEYRDREVLVEPDGDETISFSYAYRDDGSCRVAGNTLSGEFEGSYPSLGLDVSAFARTAPTGGNCEVDGLSYAFTASKDVAGFGAWDVAAVFAADKRSTSAPYAITDSAGNVLLRADGNASDPVVLPAGAAESATAALSLCRGFGGAEEGGSPPFEFCAGGNVVPVDWADGSSGRTAHLSAGAELCPECELLGHPLRFSVDLQADVGAGVFGDAVVRGTLGILSASIRHSFGLNEVDNGAPANQTFSGLPSALAGAPQDTSTVFMLGARVEI